MSGAYDGVIDFDRVLRDPNSPTRILIIYDSGDHGHPNDAGYKAMADAIDLKLFKKDENQWQRESRGSRSQLGVRILGSLAVF